MEHPNPNIYSDLDYLKGNANQKVQWLLMTFLTLIFISMCITGYLGGELVHKWNTGYLTISFDIYQKR